MTRPEPDYARVTFYHPPVLDPDPLYVPAPGTDDEPWTVPEPNPPADRRPFLPVSRKARLADNRKMDLLRGMCPEPGCDGGGCRDCDYTGFAPDRTRDTGYGWHRLPFWPWHYIQHVRRGLVNGWYSRLFCTWCVDDRMWDYYRRPTPADFDRMTGKRP